MKQLTLLVVLFTPLFITACKERKSPNKAQTGDDSNITVIKPSDTISLVRTTVKKAPVDAYREKTENPLNDWYFQVELYETQKTFHYLMTLEYEEIRGVDTLKLPNIGVPPQPVIRKGPEKYSCIVGFLDKNKVFREYKKVYVKNNALKVITLKRYRVSTHSVMEGAAE